MVWHLMGHWKRKMIILPVMDDRKDKSGRIAPNSVSSLTVGRILFVFTGGLLLGPMKNCDPKYKFDGGGGAARF